MSPARPSRPLRRPSPRADLRTPSRRLAQRGAFAALAVASGAAPAAAFPALAAATGARFPSWSAPVAPTAAAVVSTDTVVADGRVLRLDLHRRHRSVLVTRTVRNGRVRRVRVAVPVPAGALEPADDNTELSDEPSPDLFVAGGQGFATGTWCTDILETEPSEDAEEGIYECRRERSFYVRFSLRTGAVLQRAITARRRVLVGGDRVSEVVPRPRRSSVLRDAITRRTLMTVPRDALEVEGAGPYVAWKTHPNPYDPWRRVVVRRRATGARVYALSARRVERLASDDGASLQSADLNPDGSLVIDVAVTPDGVHPVTVDGAGRIRRIGRWLAHANEARTTRFGDRFVVSANPNSGPRTLPCARSGTWITDATGRLGNDLAALPATPAFARNGPPTFVDPDTAYWAEEPDDDDRSDRIRVARGVRSLPLTRAGAPRC